MQELIQNRSTLNNSQICQICCLQITGEKIQLCNPYLICYSCWYKHIKETVSKISYKTGSQIYSLFQEKPPIDICIALNTLKKQDSKEIQEQLFKKYSSFTPDIEKCPSQSCDFVFTVQKCKWRSNEEQKCPKCDKNLLQSTGWDLKGVIGFIYFVFLTNKCPKCEIPIEKTTGCPHMTCPCGHQFCWYCLKDYFFNGNNLYSVHQPRQCASIFISKAIFMSICIGGIILTCLGNQFFHDFVNYFFVGSKYVMGAIAIDIGLLGNFIGVNYLYQKYRSMKLHGNHFGHTMNWKTVVALLLIIDLSIFSILYYLDLHMVALYIVLIQILIGLLLTGTTWLIIYTVQTWFDYIC